MRTLLVFALLSVLPASAGESDFHLKDGPGKQLVEANCTMCHSLDYIQMNSPFLDRKGWEASVNKMIKAMGAPIAEADVQKIVDYLVSQYGK
ncbi:MAG: cytochrome c [Betaproteobacteria bacterium]|nr:cytochrome c [Betaproteobacteria bacterium]